MKRLICAAVMLLLMTVMIGAYAEPRTVTAMLFYPNAELTGLVKTERQITLSGMRQSHALLEELMKAPEDGKAVPIMGAGASIEGICDSGNVVTVNMDTFTICEDKLRTLSTFAIWQTISCNTNAEAVNVLIDNTACMGTVRCLKAEELSYEALLYTVNQNRAYTIYTGDKSGTLMLTMLMPASENASAEEIMKHTASSGGDLTCSWPDSFNLAGGFKYEYGFDLQGKRVLSLTYTEQQSGMRISEAFGQSGLQQWQFVAALALNNTVNIPGLQRIKLKLLNLQVASVNGTDGVNIQFPEGEIARDAFENETGLIVNVLRPQNESVRFTVEQKPMKAGEAQINKNVLLFSLPQLLEDGDINLVDVWNDSAWVDISAAFYAESQQLNEQDEERIIYAIVNSLSMNYGVSNVYFTVEGLKAETFAGEIRIDAPLHPNPGLIER